MGSESPKKAGRQQPRQTVNLRAKANRGCSEAADPCRDALFWANREKKLATRAGGGRIGRMMKATNCKSRMVAITALGAALFFAASPQAKAVVVGFEGPYAPANWTLATNGGDGSVDTAGAPASITLFGSDTGSFNPISTDFTTLAAGDGLVSFSWNYLTFDPGAIEPGPFFDRFGYLLGGSFTQLSDNFGASSQSGTASFSVVAGQTFGFRIFSTDDAFGRAQSTISSFEVQGAAIPEPGTWAAAALLVAGGALVSRRRRKIS